MIFFFFCSLHSKFFIQIFVQKMGDFTIFGSKKKIKIFRVILAKNVKLFFFLNMPDRPLFGIRLPVRKTGLLFFSFA